MAKRSNLRNPCVSNFRTENGYVTKVNESAVSIDYEGVPDSQTELMMK